MGKAGAAPAPDSTPMVVASASAKAGMLTRAPPGSATLPPAVPTLVLADCGTAGAGTVPATTAGDQQGHGGYGQQRARQGPQRIRPTRAALPVRRSSTSLRR